MPYHCHIPPETEYGSYHSSVSAYFHRNMCNIQVVSRYEGERYLLDDRLDTLFADETCAAILCDFLPILEAVPETKKSVSAVYALRLMGVGKGVHFDALVNAEKELNKIAKKRQIRCLSGWRCIWCHITQRWWRIARILLTDQSY